VVPWYRELDFDGRVYCFDVETLEVTQIDRGLKFPNGLAFGIDNALYVNETITGAVYRYAWQDGKVSGPREEYGNVQPIGDPKLVVGPDGMKFAENGYLYVATLGHGDITVLDTGGNLVERIKARGRLTTNLTFGPKGSKKIYVSEVEYGCIEVIDVGVDGLDVHR
jgi:gluconolactonase